MQTRKILLILFTLGSAALQATDFETATLGAELAARTDKFLAGTTAEARTQIAGFSDADLQKVTNEFKKSHTTSEQRIFWLSEELYRRNAERVAAERIRYLYYAVLAALLILAGFAFMTWRQASRISSVTRNVTPAPSVSEVAKPVPSPARKGNRTVKGRTKR